MKKALLLLALALLTGGASMAQNNNNGKVTADGEIYTVVEQNPEFSGGMDALVAWLGTNVKYPTAARESGLEGTVYVSFVVERDGTITTVKIIKPTEGMKELEEEAMRAVRSMPKWKPGKSKGKKVRVQFMLPIVFSL